MHLAQLNGLFMRCADLEYPPSSHFLAANQEGQVISCGEDLCEGGFEPCPFRRSGLYCRLVTSFSFLDS